ncbi:MAG: D-2-hydroxyacid dehydrogenase [Bacteroidales bacterium]
MKIVFLDEATVGQLSGLNKIKALGEYVGYDYTLPQDTAERIKGADVVITNKVIIDKGLMGSNPSLKLICIAATGTNNVDLQAAKDLNIQVKNVAGYSTESVLQITFSLLFQWMSHITQFNDYVQSGEYTQAKLFTTITPAFHELSGKRYGIIGLGAIGRRVAEVAKAFGAEVIYYSTSGNNHNSDYKQVTLEELLQTSDVISVHAPLNDQTNNLIDAASFKLTKPTAFILNVGRGGIINEAALAEALDAGRIGGAGIDVFTKEPVLATNPLMNIKNKHKLIMTPHIAWASVEARERLLSLIAKNIIDSNI